MRQNLDALASALFEAGVTRWAVSPGSRNAPVVAGLIRHGGFELQSFPDERCAAFAALGMSQATAYPCGVICTSGTAVLNFAPAVTEAYYQRVPLLVLTADRPEELIDQWDGQTIHQDGIFEPHVLWSATLPQDTDSRKCETDIIETVYQAVETCMSPVCGPVHINIPLRDPIYQDLDQPFYRLETVRPFIFRKAESETPDAAVLRTQVGQFSKVLVLAGQMTPDFHLQPWLYQVSQRLPVIGDITSNIGSAGLDSWEMAFQTLDADPDLCPELLITMGLSVTNKRLKQFLRRYKPEQHWHISTAGFVGDPFQTQPQQKTIDPAAFFHALAESNYSCGPYRQQWEDFCIKGKHQNQWPPAGSDTRTELELVRDILKHSDESICFQTGNSMAIRYAGWAGNTRSSVWCNRGTSGIDGSLSTAVGFALANPANQVVCILGDMSFLYDSNGLWTDQIPGNLHIVILNNQGGSIFNFIEGPGQEPGLKTYVNTPHRFHAEHLAAHYGLGYRRWSFQHKPEGWLESLLDPNIQITEFCHDK